MHLYVSLHCRLKPRIMDQSQLETSYSFACHWPKAGSVATSTFKRAGGCRPSICMGQREPESYGLTELGSGLSIGCIYLTTCYSTGHWLWHNPLLAETVPCTVHSTLPTTASKALPGKYVLTSF